MIRYVLLVAFLLTGAWAETGFLDRAVTLGGESYRYQVYVPLDYTPTKVWPVIVVLHGSGRGGTDGLRQTSVGLAEQIRLNRAQYPAIVVFPQTLPGASWSRPDMQDLVLAELNQAQQEFHGDSARVYLIGFSMGGAGVYRIAYRWRERFAALVAIAGAVEPPSAVTQQAVEIDRRSNGFPAAPDPFAALADGIGHIPLWIFHGDADQSVPVEQSRRLAAALKKAGSEPRYTEFSNTDHVGATAKAYTTADLITWLLAQRR